MPMKSTKPRGLTTEVDEVEGASVEVHAADKTNEAAAEVDEVEETTAKSTPPVKLLKPRRPTAEVDEAEEADRRRSRRRQ